jgi:DNA-binding NarL/FixJ family response regulator
MTEPRNKRVLLMDDSPMVLEIMGDALDEAGLDVLCARDLNELSRHCEESEVDLILMDVQMPEAFGDDVAMVLRLVRGVNALIYLLSSLSDADLADRVEEAELDGFISKSLGTEGIVESVLQILAEHAR